MTARHELLGEDFLEQADRRAGVHGPARQARAVAYLLVEIAELANDADELDLEAELWCTSDELDHAAATIEDGRFRLAHDFLAAAVANTPELDELDAIDDVRDFLLGAVR